MVVFHRSSPPLFQACLNTCRHKLIHEKCGCYQGEYIEYYTDEEIDNAPKGLCDTDAGANLLMITTYYENRSFVSVKIYKNAFQ